MNASLKSWIGQVTTGQGVMVLVPAVLAAMTGTVSWETAFPLLVAGVVGLIWPENTAMKTAAREAAEDVGSMMKAYRGTGSVSVPGAAGGM